MSASERDQDLWEMRKISKAKRALFPRPCSPEQEQYIRNSEQYKSLQEKFNAIFIKHGNNPNIFKDSERANSKRHSGKTIKCTVNRSQKRAEKQKNNRVLWVLPSSAPGCTGSRSRDPRKILEIVISTTDRLRRMRRIALN